MLITPGIEEKLLQFLKKLLGALADDSPTQISPAVSAGADGVRAQQRGSTAQPVTAAAAVQELVPGPDCSRCLAK